MGYYLLDHPNTIQQYRHPRRAALSGVVVVHTAESLIDEIDIDYGAENVASFITHRSDYGSYHEIVDSDSTVQMAPDDHETWHVAADLHNWHAWGISAACSAKDWEPDRYWTRNTITRMGARIRDFWTRNNIDIHQAAQFRGRSEALSHIPGLYLHGVVQPGDRSDAWRDSPHRARLEAMLIEAITEEEDDMDEQRVWEIVNQAVHDGVQNLATNAQGNVPNSNLEILTAVNKLAESLFPVVNQAADAAVRQLADNAQGDVPNNHAAIREDMKKYAAAAASAAATTAAALATLAQNQDRK